jgi:hypothetical protein
VATENSLLFAELADRARAMADITTSKADRHTVLRVNTQRRTVLTAAGEPAPMRYDELQRVVLARWGGS